MPTRVLVTAGAVFAGIFAFAEAAHWRSSHKRLGDHDVARGRRPWSDPRSSPGTGTLTAKDSDQIIVVLGYGNRGERPNGINRFRARAGLRSIDPMARSALLIFCGGAVTGRTSEAAILDRFAREELGFTGRSLVEDQSTTTWENIANAIPLIDRELTPSRRSASSRTPTMRRKPEITCGRCARTWHVGLSPEETIGSENTR